MSFSQKEITGLKAHTSKHKLSHKSTDTQTHTPRQTVRSPHRRKSVKAFFSYSLNTELYPLHLFLFGPFSFLTSQLDLHMQSWQQIKFGLFHCRLKIWGHMRLKTCVWCYFVSGATFFCWNKHAGKPPIILQGKLVWGSIFFSDFCSRMLLIFPLSVGH